MSDIFKIDGIIKKIAIGRDVLTGTMNFYVGQKIPSNGFIVTKIKCNEFDLVYNGSLSFYVFALNKKGKEIPWKAYHNMPVSTEYFDDPEECPTFDELVKLQEKIY